MLLFCLYSFETYLADKCIMCGQQYGLYHIISYHINNTVSIIQSMWTIVFIHDVPADASFGHLIVFLVELGSELGTSKEILHLIHGGRLF